MSERDQIYAQPHLQVTDFVFDQKVAAVFQDMISRSVPGYSTIINMTGLLASRHAATGSRLYDLGCSLGAATAAMRAGLGERDCQFVAVDNAPAMLARARENLAKLPGVEVDLICADLRDVTIENASVAVLNFTLQFLPTADRLSMLKAIRNGLIDDGVLVLSEKIAGKDAAEDELLIEMHHSFKRANGYSDLEISQKRTALENVLIPETIATHRQRLLEAGFSRVDMWFQCFNFVSFIARK